MIVSLEWLKDYTDVHVSPEEFCERMIMSGSNLETMELVGTDMKDVVVGKIVKITPHPDADKLVVCQVDIGKDAPIQIVTGAPNVFEGRAGRQPDSGADTRSAEAGGRHPHHQGQPPRRGIRRHALLVRRAGL